MCAANVALEATHVLPTRSDPPPTLLSPSFVFLLLLEKTIRRESTRSATYYRPTPSRAANIHARLELGAEHAYTNCVWLYRAIDASRTEKVVTVAYECRRQGHPARIRTVGATTRRSERDRRATRIRGSACKGAADEQDRYLGVARFASEDAPSSVRQRTRDEARVVLACASRHYDVPGGPRIACNEHPSQRGRRL